MPTERVSKLESLREREELLRLRVPETDLSAETAEAGDIMTVTPEPKISLERSPERLKVELLVTDPDILSREELREPEEMRTSLETVVEPKETEEEGAIISVIPEPETLELREPPVNLREPEEILTPLRIPSALEVREPEDMLIA